MSVSKLSKQDYISDVSGRFCQLPDELIVTILKKIRDPQTLIRCSSVCKHLQCIVSKVDAISLRFSYPGEAGDYLPCWESHYHVPQSAFLSLMKMFDNLTSLEIKLCLCPSLLPCYYGCNGAFKFLLKAVDMNDKIHMNLCMAFEVGLLSGGDDKEMLYHQSNMLDYAKAKNPLMLSFLLVILCHRPKSLRSVLILSAGTLGYRPPNRYRSKRKESGYRSGGNVFMESEQLAKFLNSSSNTRMNESWLKNPQNLVCWLKKHEENKHPLGEELWLIHRWEGERGKMIKSIVKKRDVEDLLGAFDEEDSQK